MNDSALPRLSLNRINHYLKLAKNACYYSDYTKVRMGAVLIYKNKVISVGWNSKKTSPIQKKYNKFRGYDVDASGTENTIHAEVSCLGRAKDIDIEWSRANLFIYRIKKDESSGLARPCNACMALIKSMEIKNIYYSTNNGWVYERIDN